jgi:Tol biopolymer transport system component
MIGQQLGPYSITAKLGEGGMGEVWRATDSRLDRQVAIKVLPAAFVADPERLARFEREAKLLAQLHHPNVASIFGLEESEGGRALVMELVEGEELSARIARGALPLDEALPIALQIAEALEAAHERGIVHRDLKPANIKLRADGAVKVLDFGLAKALDPATGASSTVDLARSPTLAGHGLANSPTLTVGHGTQLGVILGTAAYMAPEQARGGAVDKRADIWAFGVVLHEMLTGRSLFAGPTVSDTLAAVLKTEVDWSALPPATPQSIRALLRRCLDRTPRNRLHDIADARLVLDDAIAGRTEPGDPGAAIAAPLRRGASRWSWFAGFALGAVTLAVVAWAWRAAAPAPRPEVLRFAISAASGAAVYGGAGNSAISPDGRRVVFVGNDADGRQGLWVQELDQIPARLLAGTEDATFPFWAPDSQRVAFFARGMLNRVSLLDGRVDAICAAAEGRGGSWGRSGTIVFAPVSTGGLAAVAEAGGVPRPVTRIETPEQEISHRFPSFLPDGRRFVYIADPGAGTDEGRVFVASIDGGPRRLLYRSHRAPVYAAPGYLIDAIDDRLVARRFDPESAEVVGEPVRLAEETPTYVNTQDRVASVSESGTLLVASAESQQQKLSWLDRRGRSLGEVPLPKGRFDLPRISPDGSRVAIVAQGVKDTEMDLWIVDLATEQASRLTFAAGSETYPVWSPDGGSLAFQTNRRGPNGLWIQPATSRGAEQALYESAVAWKVPTSWVGDTLAFGTQDAATGFDVWLLRPVRPGVAPVPLLRSAASEGNGAVSPDGNWLAFDSNESGRVEVYVVSLPDARVKYQVTTEGGSYPMWTQGGRELTYLTAGYSIAAVPVALGDSLAFGPAVALFPRPRSRSGGSGVGLDVTPDGSRFVLLEPANDGGHTLIVVTNWLQQLEAEAGR